MVNAINNQARIVKQVTENKRSVPLYGLFATCDLLLFMTLNH
jgi:hypothetical protein